MSPQSTLRAPLVFDGTGDVRLFLYRYERSVGKDLNDHDKAETLIDHLEGPPLDFYCKKFLKNYSELNKDGQSYPTVKKRFIEKFKPVQRAAELATAAVDFKYDGGDIKEFLEEADRLYNEASFTPEASFGMLQRAIRNTSFPSHLMSGPTATDYTSLVKEIQRVHDHVRAYGQGTTTTPKRATTPQRTPKTPPRSPEPSPTEKEEEADKEDKSKFVKEYEEYKKNYEAVCKDLADLSLFIHQRRDTQGQGQRFSRPCGYCQEPGHSMSRCQRNPYRNKYCGYCGRLGHIVAQCYARKRDPRPGGFKPFAGPPPQQQQRPQQQAQQQQSEPESAAFVMPVAQPIQPVIPPAAANQGAAMIVTEVEAPSKAPAVNAVKRAHDGEPIRKQLRPRPEGQVADIRRPITLAPLPQPVEPPVRLTAPTPPQQPLGYKPPQIPPVPEQDVQIDDVEKENEKPKKKKKKKTKSSRLYDIRTRAAPFDVITSLANQQCGLTWAQLANGDAEAARPVFMRMIRGAIARRAHRKPKKPRVLAIGAFEAPPTLPRKHRKITGVIRGVEVPIVLDTGAIPNIMSERMMRRLNLQLTRVGGRLKLAKNITVESAGTIENLPVALGVLTVPITFTVLSDATYPILIGNPTLESLYYRICSRTQRLSLIYKGEEVHLATEYYEVGDGDKDVTDNLSEFTTDDDEEYSSTESTDWDEAPTNMVLAAADVEEEDMDALLEQKLAHLEPKHRDALRTCILKHDIIAKDLGDLRPAEVPLKHTFKLNDYTPIAAPVRRLHPDHDKEVKKQVDQMLKTGVITESTSPWAFPMLMVPKKNGKLRLCVDFRPLNARMPKDEWPLPNIDEILDDLGGSSVFTTLDLFSGYWQVRLDESIRDMVCFRCKYGSYRFEVMPFGLQNAPATFQRFMWHVVGDLDFVRVYMDDTCAHSTDIEKHIPQLDILFGRLKKFGLKINLKKCHFAQPKVTILGHVVSKEGIQCDPDKIEKVRNFPVPTTVTDVRSFLGLASYYRRFIEGFARIAKPLYQLTRKGIKYKWSEEANDAFTDLRGRLCMPPILSFPNYEKEFIVQTDASGYALGVVVSQKDDKGQEHPVAYASRVMNKAECNYTVSEKEGLAVIFALKKFRHYLLPREFTLQTDHQALVQIFNKREPTGRLARWITLIAEFKMKIQYRRGSANGNADALSRLREPQPNDTDEHAHYTSDEAGEHPLQPTTYQSTGDDDLPQATACVIAYDASQSRLPPLRRDLRKKDHLDTAEQAPGRSETPDDEEKTPGPNQAQEDPLLHLAHPLPPEQSNHHPKHLRQLPPKARHEPARHLHQPPTARHHENLSEKDAPFALALTTAEELEPALKRIAAYLTTMKRDPDDPEPLKTHRNAKSYCLINGHLYRRTKGGPKIVIRKPQRIQVLQLLHDRLGHYDREATYLLIKERAWWPSLYKDVRMYVQQCDSCQRRQPMTTGATSQGLRAPVSGLFHTISIDAAGPLPVTAQGNKYILVAIEHLTGWPMALALKKVDASEVTDFIEHIIVRPYTRPRMMISDNGTPFTAMHTQQYARRRGIKWHFVAAYNPQGNGRAERMIRTLKNAIAKMIHDGLHTWDRALPAALEGYRVRPTRERPSPFELLFGVKPYLLTEEPELIPQTRAEAFRPLEIAQVAAAREDRKHPAGKPPMLKFPLESLVLMARSQDKDRKNRKLALRWDGPYRVIAAKPPGYRLRDMNGRLTRKMIHERRLRRYAAGTASFTPRGMLHG